MSKNNHNNFSTDTIYKIMLSNGSRSILFRNSIIQLR